MDESRVIQEGDAAWRVTLHSKPRDGSHAAREISTWGATSWALVFESGNQAVIRPVDLRCGIANFSDADLLGILRRRE